MEFEWIFNFSMFTGIGAIAFLAWLLWPTSIYRKAWDWERNQEPRKYLHWIRYRTFKRGLSPLTIAMNAIKAHSFSKADLEKLNELFAKLDQPPAELVNAEIGSHFDPAIMHDVTTDFASNRRTFYVLESHAFGVLWSNKFLKKALVTKCTADRLMLHNLANTNCKDNLVAKEFLKFIFQDGKLPPDFELSDAKVKSVIDTRISEDQASEVFSRLLELHPESDFTLIHAVPGKPFDSDTMASAEGQPGQRCRVAEVIRPGLTRKSDRAWRIKALVTIRNISRNEE